MFTFSHKPKRSNKGSSSEDLAAENRQSPDPSEGGSVSSASSALQQNVDTIFEDLNEQTCVKEPGQLFGRQFTIRNCTVNFDELFNQNGCRTQCWPCLTTLPALRSRSATIALSFVGRAEEGEWGWAHKSY